RAARIEAARSPGAGMTFEGAVTRPTAKLATAVAAQSPTATPVWIRRMRTFLRSALGAVAPRPTRHPSGPAPDPQASRVEVDGRCEPGGPRIRVCIEDQLVASAEVEGLGLVVRVREVVHPADHLEALVLRAPGESGIQDPVGLLREGALVEVHQRAPA